MANTEEQIATFAASRQKLSNSNLDDFSYKLSPDKESYMETKAKIKSKFDPECDRDSDSLNCFTAFIRIARFFDIELLDVLLPLFDPDPDPDPVPVPVPDPDFDPGTDSKCLEPVAWSNARGCDSDCDRY